MSTKLHHGPRWGANFARLLHTTVCRVMACWLILTLPLYGLPVHAHAPTAPTMTPLPESFGSPFEKETSRATGGLPPVLSQADDVAIVSRATELQPLTEPAPSSRLYVNNTDPTCYDQQPCFDTIQAAIDAVQSGQTIRIQAVNMTKPFASKARTMRLPPPKPTASLLKPTPTRRQAV